MDKNLTISKLDAAKRQLETAIRLYFSNGDPVSIHTLTAAAHNIIRDVTKRRGNELMLVKDQLLEYLKPDFRKIFKEKLNEAENFFKHADRDHEATLNFNPDRSEFLIIDACSQYCKLTGEDPPLFQIYRGWFMANNQDLFTSPVQTQVLNATASMIVGMGRVGYFNTMLPLVMGMRT